MTTKALTFLGQHGAIPLLVAIGALTLCLTQVPSDLPLQGILGAHCIASTLASVFVYMGFNSRLRRDAVIRWCIFTSFITAVSLIMLIYLRR